MYFYRRIVSASNTTVYFLATSALSLGIFTSCGTPREKTLGSSISSKADSIDHSCQTQSDIGEDFAGTLVLKSDGYQLTSGATGKIAVIGSGLTPQPKTTDIGTVLATCKDDPESSLFEIKIGSLAITYARKQADGSLTTFTYSLPQPIDPGDQPKEPVDEVKAFCEQNGIPILPAQEHQNKFSFKETAGSCSIFFERGTEKDLETILPLSIKLEQQISNRFSRLGRGDVISSMPKCELYLSSSPVCLQKDSETAAVTEGGAVGFQGSESVIHMLAPSAHQGSVFGGARLPLPIYWEKVFAHEFFQGAMYASRIRSKGNDFNNCPSWYLQGLQEYFGISETKANTLETWKKSAVLAENILPSVTFGSQDLVYSGSKIDDFSYFFGVMAIKFLVETHGLEKALDIFIGKDPSACTEQILRAYGPPEVWKKDFIAFLNRSVL